MVYLLQKINNAARLTAVLGLGLASAALAAPPLQNKSATMQCTDRRVTIDAVCFPAQGRILACTRQAIHFLSADGKQTSVRLFQPEAMEKGDDYPVIDAKFGELNCVETKEQKRFIVASMFNGGNCEGCEWDDVYSTDGTFLGSTRAGKKSRAALERAFGALYDKSKRVLAHQDLAKLYENGSAR